MHSLEMANLGDRMIARFVVAVFCVVLTGCGGGSDDATSDSESPNDFEVTVAEINLAAVADSSLPPAHRSIGIDTNGMEWTAKADKSWVMLDKGAGTGSASILVSADTNGMTEGTYEATITIKGADKAVADKVSVTLQLAAPTLTLTQSEVILGGKANNDLSPGLVGISLDTGTNKYPWSIEFSGGEPDWLQVNMTYGTVGDAPNEIIFTPIDASLTGGRYATEVTVTADVNGRILSQTIPVELRLRSRLLYADDVTIAFASTPSRSRLSQTVNVMDNYGVTDTAWTSATDAGWLSAAASGVSGGTMTVTADVSGLATDVFYTGTVTISSGDPAISSDEIITVGLWVGTSDPAASVTVDKLYAEIEADSLRPWVFAHSGGDVIDIYHVYTGALLDSITIPGVTLGNMATSATGDKLYVIDTFTDTIVPVDISTKSPEPALVIATPDWRMGLVASRVEGQEVVLLGKRGSFEAFLQSTGETIVLEGDTAAETHLGVSADGTTLCGINQGFSPFTLRCLEIAVSDFETVRFVGVEKYTNNGVFDDEVGSNGKEVAVSSDGKYAVTASGWPYQFGVFNLDTGSFVRFLPAAAYPNSVKIDADDRVVGGASVSYGSSTEPEAWVYEVGGTLVNSHYVSASGKSVVDRQLTPSADTLRLVAQTDDPILVFFDNW